MRSALLALVLCLSITVAAHAADPQAVATPSATAPSDSFAAHTGIELLVGGGLNLLQFPSSTVNIDNRVNVMGYATVDYFFSSSFGVFAGAQLLSRGFKQTLDGASANATYLDIPAGLAIALPWSSGAARSLLRIGGYYAIAASRNFTGNWDMTTGFSNSNTQSFPGLYIDHATVFRATDHFGLGYTVWGKVPMGAANQTVNSHKFYEAGIGFLMSYE